MYKFNYLKKHYFFVTVSGFLFIGAFLLSFGCSQNNKNKENTFFGGKIKNPKSDFVYFFQGEKVLDSAKLNQQNKFSFNFNALEAGLYTFKTGSEFQYIYLEPQDSLLVYLNTWDFDESIVFSGKGEAKNNFLINLYLEQERNEKDFKYNYQLPEKEFNEKIEVATNYLLQTYNNLIAEEEQKPTAFFDKLAKTGIYFPFYYFKEYYPFHHRRALNLKNFEELSDNFYDFRKQIDLNDKSLIGYGPYLTYIKTYLYHLAFDATQNNPENTSLELNFMKIVNEKITIESVKNEFLASGVWKALTEKKLSEKELNEIETFFFAHCTDKEIEAEIEKSIRQKNQLKSGTPLPNIVVTNSDGTEIMVNKFAKNQPTVVFFWPKDVAQIELVHDRLNQLEKQYPEIRFLGIDRNKSNEEWTEFVKKKKLRKDNQFILSKNSENYSLFDDEMALTILVNKKGTIQNGYLFFNDQYLSNYLKNLINSNL